MGPHFAGTPFCQFSAKPIANLGLKAELPLRWSGAFGKPGISQDRWLGSTGLDGPVVSFGHTGDTGGFEKEFNILLPKTIRRPFPIFRNRLNKASSLTSTGQH